MRSEIRCTRYASDYCDVFTADRIREQLDPSESFAVDLILQSDLTDVLGISISSENISVKMSWAHPRHLASLSEETIQKMADVYTEGYRIEVFGTGKDLSKKSVVNIRYVLGFERVIHRAIENFRKMGPER